MIAESVLAITLATLWSPALMDYRDTLDPIERKQLALAMKKPHEYPYDWGRVHTFLYGFYIAQNVKRPIPGERQAWLMHWLESWKTDQALRWQRAESRANRSPKERRRYDMFKIKQLRMACKEAVRQGELYADDAAFVIANFEEELRYSREMFRIQDRVREGDSAQKEREAVKRRAAKAREKRKERERRLPPGLR